MAEKKQCRDCDYYEHQQGEDGGHCYGEPPQLLLVPGPQSGVQLTCMDRTVPAKRRACTLFVERARIQLLNS